jgi:peptidoglycan/xylan/chitin deacetylase (PgdA/CDA1 family)
VTVLIPVLLYHSVHDRPEPRDRPYTVSRACFAAHADVISASGRVAMHVSELADGLRGLRPLPDRPLALTFDDGFADNYEAVEVLLARDLPSTVYVTTGAVGSRGRLSRAAVADLARLPSVELGAHGVHHRHLDELDAPELDREVGASKLQLEDLIQIAVNSFAYPHGSYDRRVRETVIRAGYRSAAAVKNAISHAGDDPYAIARWTVTRATPPARIAQILEGDGIPLAWADERLRTRAFRTVRRKRRRFAGTLVHCTKREAQTR